MVITGQLNEKEAVIDRLVSEAIKLLSQASAFSIKQILNNLLGLKEQPMNTLTSNKLINGLMQWTHPGGPWFAPRYIRK